ncbi:hypothetical protein [Vibrio mangrovi]|uniref:Uncharacterized protein n=1 Tax=Vibrio mangrovi TaxID=474394 RepID=A0A1Y6IWD9_9VIBR|nr:hypothetical protein [Vibrio mangrovi]MDW6002501.1 hypothetical protein [Vibrio mangrovi]SMS01969.1 hypothetical protein VIM7927_03280 [Vibrio mangrovi]
MNSYQEHLQEVVGTSLDALYAQQQKLASQRRSAQYSLYYAQGAQLTAADNLDTVSEQLESVRLINQQGVKNDNLMNNLVASTHLIQSNSATTVSNSATAATNVQTAATAVAKLAADIGSALNIAAAACYGTDIYKKTLEANAFIRETANQAEYASQKAMEASSSSSEVIAKELESTATRSKAELEKLLAASQAQFKALSSARVADQEALSTARQTEKKAEGALEDAQSAESAIDGTVQASNDTLNFNLAAVAQGDQQITVSFQPFTPAFSQLPEQCAAQLGKTDGSLPAPAPHYFVFIVSADKKSSVKLEQVESTFAEFQKERFTEVLSKDAKGNYQTVLKCDTCLDFGGKPLERGRDYLVYMYAVLDLAYQKYIGSYSNVLSSASPAVTLLTPLPVAENISFDEDSREITFNVTMNMKQEPEFRVMLLPAYQPLTGGLMVAPLPTASTSALNFYFNQSIAMQVSSANYQLAHIESTTLKNGKLVHQMSADLSGDMTDNFGNPLIAGMLYIPVVLVTPAPGIAQGSYASSLSALDIDPILIIPNENYLAQEQSSTADKPAPVSAEKDDGEDKKARRANKKSESDDDQE